MFPEDSLQKYQDKFLYKAVDHGYFVEATAKAELKTKILKPFADNNLLKFIGMKRKYNPYYVNAFYYNMELTFVGLKNRFKNKVGKFDYSDFNKYFGLSYERLNMSNAKESNYDKVSFVLSISKYVCEHMEMSNLSISHIEFDMRLLHWIVVKILARKLTNSRRNDHNDLFFIWILTHKTKQKLG